MVHFCAGYVVFMPNGKLKLEGVILKYSILQ